MKYPFKASIFLFLIFLPTAERLCAQNTIAIPDIVSYTKEDYNAGSQNWKIVQDDLGIIYVANDEGLLTFDGNHWKKYVLPNESIVRSLALGPGGRIYVGAQGEIGYFAPDHAGLLVYHSLTGLIPPNHREFADIWNVIILDGGVFFRSNKKIFHFTSDKIIAYPSPNWDFMGYASGMLIANEYERGLLRYKNGIWEPFVENGKTLKDIKLIDFVALKGDSSLIVTKTSGIFCYSKGILTPFVSGDLQQITDKIINGLIVVSDDNLAIATSLAGCFIINRKGKLIQRLSRHEGLQNNNIIAISADKNKNIWLGLDNGIDFIAYNSAIRHIYPDYQEHNTAYAAIIHKQSLYLGLSSGLYRAPVSSESDISNMRSDFTRVNNTHGQVWNLSEVNDQLIMGHNDGAYIIENNNATRLDGSSGFWVFLPLSPIQPSNFMLAGTYNGINIYDYRNGRFYDSLRHVHFESSRFIAMDDNIAWVGHPYLGLFKVDFKTFPQPKFAAYIDKQKILSKNRNYVYKIKNRIILSNDNGLFEYDSQKDDFVPCNFLRKIFDNEPVQYLKEDQKGNIWFIKNKHLGVVDFSNGQPHVIFIPEMDSRLLTSGYDFIYPFDLRNVFVAGEHGFYLLNYEKYKSMSDKISLLITSVKAIGDRDSSVFGGHLQQIGIGDRPVNQHAPELGYAWNTLHFTYSSPLFGRQASTEYSCMLENFDKAWSPWSKKTEKEYLYLPPGNYVFKVKVRSHTSGLPVLQSYQFTVLPPWYKTGWAWLLYTSIFGLIIIAIYHRQKRKFEAQRRLHEEENKRLQYLHQLEIKKSEAEIVKLNNEKLEAELQLKNKELATTSINLVQRGEVLHKIKDEVLRMKKTGNEHEHNEEDFRKIIRMLEPEKVKHDWEQFALHFNHVHDEFLVALKREYPGLTPNEIKLCAYLRLNISSKEIAHIMNINVKSVELSRYRLRKKLQLEPGVHLFNFLLEFHGQHKKDIG